MKKDLFAYRRKSYMELDQIYFWTATINKWQKLLLDNRFKEVIITSLSYLSLKKKIDVFAFIIMPDYIRFVWRVLEQNRGEMTVGSFLIYTAHEFKKLLRLVDEAGLSNFKVNAFNKSHEFWQRDSLAVGR